jgi:UPF0176 protein
MRTAPAAALAATAILLAGCSGGGPPAAAVTTSPVTTTAPRPSTEPSTAAPAPAPAAALPAVPTAQTAGNCPYLSADDVSAFNGEKVYGVKLDPTQDPPACFFARGDGSPQLSVWVYAAPSAELATAAVDRAAPVATTDPAAQPAGWTGGSSGGPGGAVYAVAKGAVAVVVTSNQEQSVKARRVTEQVISALGL